MKLYGYFRSSAAYRVRIALNLKGLDPERAYIHLRRKEQNAPEYVRMNPFALVPTLEHDGHYLTQSLAIIEYLEEIQPLPPLLPQSSIDRAYVRSLALSIACDIHPLNNLRVLNYLIERLRVEPAAKDAWYAHWIKLGLTAFEAVVSCDSRVGTYCFGDTPGLADLCLVPQVYSAERMKCDLTDYPTVRRLAANARKLPAFQAAAPELQPDAD